MTDNIKELFDECQEIQAYLEQKASEEPNELTDRISNICIYMARSGNMLAEAKYIQDMYRQDIFNKHETKILEMSATVANKFIESQLAEVNMLVNWIDRINRSCTHQADSLRTIMSYVKENLKLTKGGY